MTEQFSLRLAAERVAHIYAAVRQVRDKSRTSYGERQVARQRRRDADLAAIYSDEPDQEALAHYNASHLHEID
jgi:hypothetical protein